jgi:hypothetical protein
MKLTTFVGALAPVVGAALRSTSDTAVRMGAVVFEWMVWEISGEDFSSLANWLVSAG